MLVALLAIDAATAQSSTGRAIDAHGFFEAPTDGDLTDPLAVWRAEPADPTYYGVSALFEYADDPLVRYFPDGSEQAELDDVLALNLGGSFGLHERIAVSVALPLVLTSHNDRLGRGGPTLADAHLAVPIALLYPDDPADDERGVYLSAVPMLTLPLGSKARSLGAGGLTGGGVLAARFDMGALEFALNAGALAERSVVFENLRGGSRFVGGAAVAAALSENLALRAEFAGRASFDQNMAPGTESPAEILLSLRDNTDAGPFFTVGGAAGVAPGAGAAAFRAFLGVGYAHGKPKDTDLDGIIDDLDACVDQPETVNQHKDDDGCPDVLADLKVQVVDPKSLGIDGALVQLDDKVYTADPFGYVKLEGLMPGTKLAGKAAASGYIEQPLAIEASREGMNEVSVMLTWKPAAVALSAVAVDGKGGSKPLEGNVVFKGRGQQDTAPVVLAADGTATANVSANVTWTATFVVEGYLPEKREFTPKPGEQVAIAVQMRPAKAVIRGTEITILEQVKFDFGKATIKPDSFALLDQIAQILVDNPQITKVEVQGHTDDKGSDTSNQKLSQQRVESVVKYLTEHGVTADRLVAVGYGETKPLVPNTSDANRAQNRRVQFVILSQAP